MRFDPSVWAEVDVGGFVMEWPSGTLRINASAPVALFVSCDETQGDDVLVGSGNTFEVELVGATGVRFFLTGGPETRAFVYVPQETFRPARAGSWTNPDRPDMMVSESMDAVLRELRMFKLQARQERDALRRERLRSGAAVGGAEVPVAPPTDEGKAAAEPDPAS